MELIQEHEGYNWRAKDAGGLYFRHSGTEKPLEVTAWGIGHFTHTAPRIVALSELQYLACGLFGPGRPSDVLGSTTKWTGDSYKFAVYTAGRMVVIMRTDGGGDYFYYDDHAIARETWEHLAKVCSQEMLWNVCYQIVFAYESGQERAEKEVMQAVADGKLKIVRKRGKRGYFFLKNIA